MTTAEVVVFDLGKVLLDFDYRIAARALAGNGTCTAEAIYDLLLNTPLLLAYERGEHTSIDFYNRFCSSSRYTGSLEEFSSRFGAIFTPIEPMIKAQAALKHQGFPTFIFSNTNELAIQYIRKTYPFFSGFDGYILSFEHRWMKPDPRLYEVVEQKTGRRASAILYIDDRAENVEAGKRRGWQTILHQDPEETRRALELLKPLVLE